MRLSRKAFLLACLIPVSATAKQECNQACTYARQVAQSLNSAGPKIGRFFSAGSFSSEGGKLTARFQFDGNRGELDALLGSTQKTQVQFYSQLDQIALSAGCAQPVRRLITQGGTAEFRFTFSDNSTFHAATVSRCE